MKLFKILIPSLFLLIQLQAQDSTKAPAKPTDRSPFRKGYLRLGFSSLGNSLDNSLSPKDNILKGNYGASQGYVFETGHVYYFKPKSYRGLVNFGLDWTILSLTYNKLDKWENYSNKGGEVYTEGAMSASIASKLGPVISFNPVEKLVIDLRAQVSAVGRVTPFEYYEENAEGAATSFSFYNYGQEDIDETYDSESIKNLVAFGFGSNFGITIRRKAIGLSVDYSSVNAKTNYDAWDSDGNHTYGKEKIPTHSVQFKLSFTF